MYMASYLDSDLTSAVNCRRWRRPTLRCRPSSPEGGARKGKSETGRPGPMLSFTKTFRSPYNKTTIISIDTNPCMLCPTPSHSSECVSPPWTQRGRGSNNHLRVSGWGGPNSDDWAENLEICILCGGGSLFFCCRLIWVPLPPFLTSADTTTIVPPLPSQ